ncbi:HigA family addiction module antitoxin [Tistrella mobilis]|uniref:HigA family addiction module antitoxin n=1 Tax=Tistrella mobilis TaxID=171437 RepID=UPI0035569895
MHRPEGLRLKSPAHPGAFIREDIMAGYELTVTDAARILGVTRPALSALVNERARLSPEMALRIEKAFGVAMETLMRMQMAHDIAEMRKAGDAVNVAPFAAPGERPAAPAESGKASIPSPRSD